MRLLEGNASDILKDWVEGKYELFYKYDGIKFMHFELYETESKTS